MSNRAETWHVRMTETSTPIAALERLELLVEQLDDVAKAELKEAGAPYDDLTPDDCEVSSVVTIGDIRDMRVALLVLRTVVVNRPEKGEV